MRKEILRTFNINKTLHTKEVLHNVNINLFENEILGLIGANGSGKTTLLNILSGTFKKDSGTIYFEEQHTTIRSIAHAQKLGIYIARQNSSLIENMTVVENIFLMSSKRTFLFNKKVAIKKIEGYLLEFCPEINPNQRVSDIKIAQKKMLELIKGLYLNAKIILLDEVTSSLSANESRVIKDLILKFKKMGISVIFSTNRIEEALNFCERITVIRDGEITNISNANELDRNSLVLYMFNSSLKTLPVRIYPGEKDEVLRVERESETIFTLHKGEVLGAIPSSDISKKALIHSILGDGYKNSFDFFSIYIKGELVDIKDPFVSVSNRIGYIPQNRMKQSLIPEFNAKHNISFSVLNRIRVFGFIRPSIETYMEKYYFEMLRISESTRSKNASDCDNLSQQKIMFARCLASKPEIIIMDEPTIDIDSAEKIFIYEIINKLRQQGKAILLFSSDMNEIELLSDHIIKIPGSENELRE